MKTAILVNLLILPRVARTIAKPIKAFATPNESSHPVTHPRMLRPKHPFSQHPLWTIALISLLSQAWGVLAINRADAQPNDAKIGRIRPEAIAGWLSENQVPAVGIGIIENGALNEVKVYGKQQTNVPVPVNTVFNVASLTKPVVAMLTLTLVSRGQWKLDEPLARYWVDPDVKADPWHKKLTTPHVLSHQSGFVNWRWNHPSKKLTFDVEPGTKFGYSGEGFEYLKRALESKFGKPLEQLADSLLFKPLGMHDTRFYWNGPIDESRFAHEYDQQGKRYETQKRTDASAADDLLTTVGDYGQFGAAVLNGTGLSKEIVQEMSSPQSVVDSGKHLFWGLGWELINDLSNGEYALFHSGSDRGVRTMVVLLPKSKRGLVILTNGDKGQEVYKKMMMESLNVGKEIVERLK